MSYDPHLKIIKDEGANDGISIRDLQRCFGVVIENASKTVRGLSCDLGVIFKGSTGDTFTDRNNVRWTVVSRVEVNKWAKNKPLRRTKIGQLAIEDQQNETPRPTPSTAFGYGIYQAGSEPTSPFDTNGNYISYPWLYNKPTFADTNCYARFTDYNNYYHYAPCPIEIHFPDGNEIEFNSNGNGMDNLWLAFTLSFETGITKGIYRTDGSCMALNEIFNNENVQVRLCYMCVVFWKKVEDNYITYYAFSSAPPPNTDNYKPISDVIGGTTPILQTFVNLKNLYYNKDSSNTPQWTLKDGDVLKCRVLLCDTYSASSASKHFKFLQYDDDPTECDYREFTVRVKTVIERLGVVTITAELTKYPSEKKYRLSSITANIEPGSFQSGSTVAYKIFGTCPTGKFDTSSTTVDDGRIIIKSGNVLVNNQDQDLGEVSASVATWNFTTSSTDYPGAPCIAIVGIVFDRTSGGKLSQDISLSFDCTSGNSKYTKTVSQ